jgi:hypothetical protein
MRVRDLKFGTVNAWPPIWRTLPGRGFAIGEEGILLGARVRWSGSLMVRMRSGQEEHEGLLTWDGPPAPQAFAELLNRSAGKSIADIGDLPLPV